MKKRPQVRSAGPGRFRANGLGGLREIRAFPLEHVEVRAAEGDQPLRIIGHAAVYNRWSDDLGGFREQVLPGAFTKALADRSDVRCLFNHDANFIMGRTKSGTLELSDEAKGLHYEALPPDTQTIRDLVITPMQRGDIDQCSFAFSVVRDEWRDPTEATRKDGLWERDLIELRLYDVSPVTFPAYPTTDVAVRSLLTGAGLDWDALAAFLVRADRGLAPTQSDIDLVTGSIDALRAYLPSAPEPELHPDAPDAARHRVAHLRRLLEHEEAIAS